MAYTADKLKKHNSKGSGTEWSKSGTFLHKPDRGWIHPNEQLAAGVGICYGVRYIGCLEVKESMKALNFDTRTALAREAINRVSETAGLKNASKRKKAEKRIIKMLGESPYMKYAGCNVNLTITVESINLMIMESGEVIANHLMAAISFASGGDAETLDFVAYVARDGAMGRACHVLECGGGLSEDVITTIGQAFELRFKEYLKHQPKPVHVPHRLEQSFQDGDAWGGVKEEENEYYNDNPAARPPSPKHQVPSEYSFPLSNIPVSDGVYSSVTEKHNDYDTAKEMPLIDFSDGGPNVYDNSNKEQVEGVFSGHGVGNPGVYDNHKLKNTMVPQDTEALGPFDINKKDFSKDLSGGGGSSGGVAKPGVYDNHQLKNTQVQQTADRLDPFNMKPFQSFSNGHTQPRQADLGSQTNVLSSVNNEQTNTNISLMFEEWYHGNLTRKQAEKLLENDGDFLVRQSSNDTNQYVLSGRQHGVIKHLLLVDPAGVVRTKDHSFDSVPHLINFHQTQNIPIVSQESVLHLKQPISNKITVC